MICIRKHYIYFLALCLIILIGHDAYGYSSISIGGFQGYQVISQKETIFKTSSTLASLPTFGIQLQFQTTLGARFGLRLKYEAITVKFQTPPEGFLSSETFRTTNTTIELPYQHNIHWQNIIKFAKKERVLYNLDDTLRFDLYKSRIYEAGLGINYDSQNLGSLVYGVGSTISLLSFESKNINDVPDKNMGAEFEARLKLGWIYEAGWGNIFRVSYSTFYLPNTVDKNIGREIKFFGEFIKIF